MSSLISIIIPAKNVGQFIEKTIVSIFNQTYPYFEIIAVENCSTDSTLHVLNKLSSIDNRLKVYSLPNCTGVSLARNYGLSKATGDYICFIDGDDLVFPEFLEKLIAPLLRKESDFSICDMTFDGKSADNRTFPKKIFDFSCKEDFLLGIRLCAGSACAKLFKRTLIGELQYRNMPIGEDSLFVLEIYLKKPRATYVPYIGYHYVQHILSSLHRVTYDKIDANFLFFQTGKIVLEKGNSWSIAGKYWKSRALTNSIERFRQISDLPLKKYWKSRFVYFLQSDFYKTGISKSIAVVFFKTMPLFIIEFVLFLRCFFFNVARSFVNLINAFKFKLKKA